MSVLRFLAPHRLSRASSPSPSSSRSQSKSRSKSKSHSKSRKKLEPIITIRVPSYGSVFMDQSHQGTRPLDHSTIDNGVRESRGEIEVEIPVGMGNVRVKKIRVGLRTVVELSLNMMRVKERDEIFKREVEIVQDEEGIVLREGYQRFDFVLLLPSNLCSHDRHPNGKIAHNLYAEIEGIDDISPLPTKSTSRKPTKESSTSGSRSPFHHTSDSPSSLTPNGTTSPLDDHTPTYIESTSDTPQYAPEISAVNAASLTSALQSMELDQDGQAGPSRGRAMAVPAPPYRAREGYVGREGMGSMSEREEIPWYKGTARKERYMEVLYNCHPEGGVSELDVVVRDAVPGLGPFELKLESDCWTIGGLLFGTLKLLGPSDDTTIFSLRVSLIQTHKIRSPRDDPATTEPTVTRTIYPLFTVGERPVTSDKNPGPKVRALWRGVEAGGSDSGEGEITGRGRNPPDSKARPSSVRDVPTPITVSHKLAIEVLFSVWGEDEHGNKLPGNGPGALRALVVEKGTMVASCAFTPEELRLPSYGSLLQDDAFSHLARKCPLCGKDPPDKLCPTCPPTSLPHPRHDHPPKLVGNEQGICPLCAEDVVPRREPTFEDCACGMREEYLLERFLRRQKGQRESDMAGGESLEEIRGRKVEVERGRRM